MHQAVNFLRGRGGSEVVLGRDIRFGEDTMVLFERAGIDKPPFWLRTAALPLESGEAGEGQGYDCKPGTVIRARVFPRINFAVAAQETTDRHDRLLERQIGLVGRYARASNTDLSPIEVVIRG